ncbi:diguanylate cyclase [Natronospira proteinivora]|uniref:diguanylate cyclase n=1 Tax=Natronospira proteinivora TaxID=1807133 RepID=UPI00209C7735
MFVIAVAFVLFSPALYADSGPLIELEAVEAELMQDVDDEQRLSLLLRRGQLARGLGRYAQAKVDAREAIELAETLGSPEKRGRALHLLGTVKAEQGRLAEAIDTFFEAREILADTDDHAGHGRALMAIGVAYLMAEEYRGGRDYLEEARALAETHGLDGLKLAAINNLAIVAQNLEGMEASLSLYQEALDLARAQDNQPEVARVLALLCQPLVETGQLDDAEAACLEGKDLLDELGSLRLRAGVGVNLARLRLAQGEPDQAEAHLREAVDLAEGKVPTVERDAHRVLYELYEERGDYRLALEAYQRVHALNESMLAEDRRRESARLEAQYELDRSEREIELLELDRQLAAVRMQRQRWMLWGTGSGLIILSFVAFFIWRVYRARAQRGEELAARDPLTGLLNRRGFTILADLEASRGQREGYTKAIAMADIDHFKPINDQYGHAIGDTVLKVISDRLQNNVRGFDSVIRWGGEEFLIMLPRVAEAECFELASRLLEAVTRDPVETEAGSIPIQMTIGIAQVTDGFDDAVARADEALYEGKRAGRNRVIVAD